MICTFLESWRCYIGWTRVPRVLGWLHGNIFWVIDDDHGMNTLEQFELAELTRHFTRSML